MKSLVLAAALLLLPAFRAVAAENADWRSRLYTPTSIVKTGGYYFIVDCWHHRVLWTSKLAGSLTAWKTLDEDLAGPHSFASDGTLYLVEDTGRHRVCVYRSRGEGFQRVPADSTASANARTASATTRTRPPSTCSPPIRRHISKLVRQGERMAVRYAKRLDFLQGEYTRSMTIFEGEMCFVSGPGAIVAPSYRDNRYGVLATYALPPNSGLGGMNDLFHTDDGWWYLTATPGRIVRTRSLAGLARGRFEDVGRSLGLRGTPYYLAQIDGRYYVPQITEHSGIVSFVHRDGRIGDVRAIFDFGPPTAADHERKAALPL